MIRVLLLSSVPELGRNPVDDLVLRLLSWLTSTRRVQSMDLGVELVRSGFEIRTSSESLIDHPSRVRQFGGEERRRHGEEGRGREGE